MAQTAFANRVMYDGLYTFVMRILNVVCAAGLGILTARLLGPSGKGIYALPSVEAGLIVSIFSGVGSAASYFLLNRNCGKSILRPALLSGAFFLLGGVIALVPIALFSGRQWALLPAILSLPPAAAINLAAGYAIGIKRVRFSTTINVALTIVTFALMAIGLFFVARSAVTAIAVWITASFLVAGVAIAYLIANVRSRHGTDHVGVMEYSRFGIKVGLVNLVSLLNYRADMYLVALLTAPASLGMYTVAVSAAESLLVPTQVAALVTSPHIGSLDRDAAASLTARCVRNNLLVALVVCGALFVLAAPIVHLLYGRAFMPVVPVLQVLLLGVLAMSLGSPMSSYFTLKLGRPEVPLWLAGGSAVICIAVSVLLIPKIGIIGAATGSTLAYAAGQIAAIWYFGRIARVGVRQMLVPTMADMRLYYAFLRRVLADGQHFFSRA
jgi:O-antigen/teichoic acid export membrane protein